MKVPSWLAGVWCRTKALAKEYGSTVPALCGCTLDQAYEDTQTETLSIFLVSYE